MKNSELNRIKEILRIHSDFLRRNYHVKKIGVFGSVARGKQQRQSDIDIMVDFLITPAYYKIIS